MSRSSRPSPPLLCFLHRLAVAGLQTAGLGMWGSGVGEEGIGCGLPGGKQAADGGRPSNGSWRGRGRGIKLSPGL